MISDEYRLSVLSAYAAGVIARYHAMELLGIDEYGDLLDQVADAGLAIKLPDEVCEAMRQTLNDLFDGLSRKPKENSNE